MEKLLGEEWYKVLEGHVNFDNLAAIGGKLRERGTNILPPSELAFNAFKLCPPSKTKVVILGQDPYHTPGVAHGLAFSSAKKGYTPPSLRYIFKALEHDGYKRTNPNLTDWATQGVLLLNTVLTVDEGKANSHAGLGWEEFTKGVINCASCALGHVVFLLWGRYAGSYAREVIPFCDNIIFKAPHPAAEAYQGGKAGFITCGHFKKTNKYLEKHGLEPINW